MAIHAPRRVERGLAHFCSGRGGHVGMQYVGERSPVTRSAVARRVARAMSRYLPPAAPAGPATYKYPAGNGLRRVVPERRANLA